MDYIINLLHDLIFDDYYIKITKPQFDLGIEIQLFKLIGDRPKYIASQVLTETMIREAPDGFLSVLLKELKERIEEVKK